MAVAMLRGALSKRFLLWVNRVSGLVLLGLASLAAAEVIGLHG